jgi:threonylcarbamoyladenosine tRNA methylthiotransferase MtaB
MQRIAITTLGCKINQFESAAMAETLGRNGFQVVPFEDEADIYVINTCTVTARTDAESRRLIRRARIRQPEAKIVVTGCYAQVAFDQLREMEGVQLILGNTEKKGIALLMKEIGDEPQVLVSDISLEQQTAGVTLESFAEHTRAFLQVQTGCNAFCSYCIVPYARGRSRSVPFEEALGGIRSFAAKGFKEVVLTGIHLGVYGLDLTPRQHLIDLLSAAEKERLAPRLRIGSLEPTEITTPLIRFFATSEIICRHLHIPLQSGHDQVLERMNRHYTTGQFREVTEELATAIPDICQGCDVIAGFPGETDSEFEASYSFIDALPIAYLHVFPFSPRPGTPAATMPDQVPGAVIRERAAALRRLSERKKLAYHEKFVGRELKVLVQERKEGGMVKGLSRNYIPVMLTGDANLINSEIPVQITGTGKNLVRGEYVDPFPGTPLILPNVSRDFK